MLQLARISKSYTLNATPVPVLHDVSLQAGGGEAIVFLGPSGSGKSTLLHIIGTLEKPSAGEIFIEGKNPAGLSADALARLRNQSIGFIFQDHHLLPQYSVLENVLLPALAFAKITPEAEENARRLLDRVNLSHRLNHRPAELSGGEKQRVAIARALINSPRLLLCDEPTGNLDSQTAATISNLLFELHNEQKNVLIMVTHSADLAQRFSRKYQLIAGGLAESD